jgi:hypothetical protein
VISDVLTAQDKDRLREKVESGDLEALHIFYDGLLYHIAESYDPELVHELDSILGDLHKRFLYG